jgi:hypothetical protein
VFGYCAGSAGFAVVAFPAGGEFAASLARSAFPCPAGEPVSSPDAGAEEARVFEPGPEAGGPDGAAATDHFGLFMSLVALPGGFAVAVVVPEPAAAFAGGTGQLGTEEGVEGHVAPSSTVRATASGNANSVSVFASMVRSTGGGGW